MDKKEIKQRLQLEHEAHKELIESSRKPLSPYCFRGFESTKALWYYNRFAIFSLLCLEILWTTIHRCTVLRVAQLGIAPQIASNDDLLIHDTLLSKHYCVRI